MIDPKIIAELDQAKAAIVELMPGLWRQLYLKCIEEGFSQEQSFAIIKTYIMSSAAPPAQK